MLQFHARLTNKSDIKSKIRKSYKKTAKDVVK